MMRSGVKKNLHFLIARFTKIVKNLINAIEKAVDKELQEDGGVEVEELVKRVLKKM